MKSAVNTWKAISKKGRYFSSLALIAVMGCGGGTENVGPVNPNFPVGLPPIQPPASSNNFTGTQGPGLWTANVDDIQAAYSYQAQTYPPSKNASASGRFLPVAGFLSLTGASGQLNGYATEVRGRAVLFASGDATVPPIFSVVQDRCFPINGNVRFQYVYVPNEYDSTIAAAPVYGSIEAQTSADGVTWSFGGQAQYVLPYTIGAPGIGTPVQPGTTLSGSGSYLSNFTGQCAVTNGIARISAPPNVTSVNPKSSQPVTFVVGPTGFFLEDQSTGKQTGAQNADAFSFIGVIQPSSPLTTSSIIGAKYVGFMREARFLFPGFLSKTEPIGFGQIVAGSGTTMTGGTYLNDDITQFQNSNIVVNLGTQDPTNNGLYSLASITVPDPQNVCFIDPTHNKPGTTGVPGVDPFGNETCTFNAVAVAGNPENKFAIFIASFDVVNNVPMTIYLFQQP